MVQANRNRHEGMDLHSLILAPLRVHLGQVANAKLLPTRYNKAFYKSEHNKMHDNSISNLSNSNLHTSNSFLFHNLWVHQSETAKAEWNELHVREAFAILGHPSRLCHAYSACCAGPHRCLCSRAVY